MISTHRLAAVRLSGVALTVVLTCTLALAVDPDITRLPGYVDGTVFVELADPDGTLVEISLPGKILNPFCGVLQKQDPDLEVVCGLEWIGAVVLEYDEPSPNLEKARQLVLETEERLQNRGWERLARIQERGEMVRVLMLVNDDVVSGLVVLVVEENEIVFANVAGHIDMNQLGALAEKMELPGLEEIEVE
jgi:hypothetical protein